MTIFAHEIKQSKKSLIVWTAAIAFMMGICLVIYPDISKEMGEVGDMFANMGAFSAAFGMDKLNFGEFIGFFGIECGNILGLGGAFFAALLGISALAKEEKEHTAEFLLAAPISRTRIIAEKLAAVFFQIIVLNIIIIAVTALSVIVIGEDVEIKTLSLLFLAYLIMQLETAAITFGISAFLKRNSLGIGLGLAAVFYFLNIISNLIDKTEFIKYLTPFGYTESADIIADNALKGNYLAAGIAMAVIFIALAFWKYNKKDIS